MAVAGPLAYTDSDTIGAMPNASGVDRSIGAEAALVLLGFTLLAVAATFPLIRVIATHLPGDLGDPVMNTWLLAWDASRLRHGLAGLWDAPNFFPYRHTLAYSDHLLGLAMFTSPLQWATGNPVLVHNVAFLASFALSGAGMYVLARTLTGRWDAAVVAGAIYAFTPYRISQLAHVQMLMLPWLPLSLWALHRYFSLGALRLLLASSGFFLLQALTAGYFMYFAILPLTIVGIAELRQTRPPPGRLLLHLAIAVVVIAGVLAPIVSAYYRVRREYGLRRTTAEITELSADVRDYLSASPRVWIWRRLATDRNEHNLFPGALVLMLSAIAIAVRPREPAVRMYGAIAAIAFVLSLGPRPTAWGHHLPISGPYAWLLRIAPGLDGLRVVARLDFIFILGLAVVGAFGATWLLDRVGRRGRSAVFAVLLLAAVGEGWAAPIPTARFDPLRDVNDRDAYAYLKGAAPGAVLELPIALESDERNFTYQFLTLVHQHPIVNGHSGYYPPLLTFLGSGHSPFNEPERLGDAFDTLRRIGVRYLMLHLGEFENRTIADALMHTVDARTDLVVAQRRFKNTVVVTLAPEGPPPPAESALRRVATESITPRASHGGDRVRLAFDGDRDSRWLTGGRQTGTERLELQLDEPRDIRLLRMQLAPRSFGDYPRELAIDVVEDRGPRTVFRGPVLTQFVQGLLANGAYPYIDIALPPNRARALKVQQLSQTNRFFWSIHELELWER
jgi:hypothetical protein